MTARRFILVFASATLGVAAVLAGFNIAVDPYLVFNAPRISGFNVTKPAVETREWMMKAYQAPRVDARTVVLGSSRTDIGLDPASAAWPSIDRPVYNLSLAGADTDASLRYLQHMLAIRGGSLPTLLVVGLDFENFLVKPSRKAATDVATAHAAPPVDEVGERLALLPNGEPNPSRRLRVWKDYGASALSLDALTHSIQTVIANHRAGQPDVDASGHLSEARFTQWVDSDGVAALFEQKNAMTVRDLNTPHRALTETLDGPVVGFEAVHRLVAFAKQHGMRLVLSAQPSHAMRLELLDLMGYWRDYESWKRGLTQIAAAARADGVDISLWDFGGYDDHASEAVPADRDRQQRLRWFWDPVHYTVALGDLMLANMLGQPGASPYGVRLEPTTLDARLAQVRAEQAAYRELRPKDVSRVRQQFCKLTICKPAPT